jgi:tRNA(Ile)-lysidine synthase
MDWAEPGPEGHQPPVDAVYGSLISSGPGLRQTFPGGIFVERRYDRVCLSRGSPGEFSPFEAELAYPGRTVIREIGRTVNVEEMDLASVTGRPGNSPDVAYLDAQTLSRPLKMRSFRPGDRFRPLGMKGTQKVKQFFIDHKVPRFERPMIPLLVSGEDIVWIVGHRTDDRVKVTESTKRVVKIEVMS